jgi:enolase
VKTTVQKPGSSGKLELHARQILDSRGNPTIEVEAHTPNGVSVGQAPSGASTGTHEAVERRDGGKDYDGKAVTKNVQLVNTVLKNEFTRLPQDWRQVDLRLLELNGKANLLGGNTTTAVSIACAKAAALEAGKPFHTWLGGASPLVMPVPFFNIINGGMHAGNSLPFQEFMLCPIGATTFSQAVQYGSEIYHELKGVLKEKYGPTAVNVGDEGGFAPPITDVLTPLDLIVQAAENRGLESKIGLAVDAAASTFYKNGLYHVQKPLNHSQFCKLYADIISSYPVVSLEDPFAEDDLNGFSMLNSQIGSRVQVVGDDILCTNAKLVQMAVDANACNCMLLKVNQAGTLAGSLDAAKLAWENGWGVMVSHRSGETEDPFIAELVVGLGCGQIKSGAPARAERTAKYNQLLRIEESLGSKARYAGRNFHRPKAGWLGGIG